MNVEEEMRAKGVEAGRADRRSGLRTPRALKSHIKLTVWWDWVREYSGTPYFRHGWEPYEEGFRAGHLEGVRDV